MPRSPPPSDRYTPHYPPSRDSRDTRRPYRDDYDRRDSRDDYDRRRPAPASYRGRREYASPPPRGRDRSWDRERDRERDYPRERERERYNERERYDDRDRKRSRSPLSPRRRFSPPPRDDRFRRYTSYDRPPSPTTRVSGLTYAPAETPAVAVPKDDGGDVSEEEGMVTPPGVKRKLEDVKAAEPEPKPRPASPKRRVVDSPPHQINRSAAPAPTTITTQTTPAATTAVITNTPATTNTTATTTEPLSRPDAPFKIALPSVPIGRPKPSPNTPAFGQHERPSERRAEPPSRDEPPRTSRPAPRQAYASNERDRERGRRYSTSSSFASRSRSPRRRRSRSRSRTDSRSRSRSRTRSTRSPSRTRSPAHEPPRGPSLLRRPPARAPPTGPAADPVPTPAVRNFIPTGPRGRGRGPLVAPRAPRAERLGYAQPFRGRPVPPPRETELPKPDVRKDEPVVTEPVLGPGVPVEATPVAEEPKGELAPDREERVKIQFKRDEPPALSATKPLVSPIAPISSPATPLEKPATPFEKPAASPAPKIASSPVDYASTPAPEEPAKTEIPAKKPSYISLPARPRAPSTANPPTPGIRTPAPPTAMRQTTYPRPVAPVWKEYAPPREITFRDRPTGADVVLELKAMGVHLPEEGYRSLSDRDTTRIAGDWERQLAKMQYERTLLTHSFQTIASGLRVKKFEVGNALDEVWVAERKIEAAGMTMETAGFSPKRE